MIVSVDLVKPAVSMIQLRTVSNLVIWFMEIVVFCFPVGLIHCVVFFLNLSFIKL